MAEIPDFNKLLASEISETVMASEKVKEVLNDPPPQTISEREKVSPDQSLAEQSRAWYANKIKERIFLIQRINFMGSALTQIANTITSQLQLAEGIPDLSINKPILSVQLETALTSLGKDLSPALQEIKELLEQDRGDGK